MPIRIRTPFPSVANTARRLGIAESRAKQLARFAMSDAGSSGPKTQSELVEELAKACAVSAQVARQFLETYADVAIRETKKNGVFELPGIGRLVRVERKARAGRNPSTGAPIKIPSKKIIKFRASKSMKDAFASAKK